jgi:DNA polymerase-3 subunit epsilon
MFSAQTNTVTPEEEMARRLEETGNFRILRRLVPRAQFADEADGEGIKTGLILDVETTGLEPAAEIIELGMVKFSYCSEGRVCRVLDVFSAFSEPSIPIPPEVSELTGITPAMVWGQRIDPMSVFSFTSSVDVVIAHVAQFDRRHSERAWPHFEHLPWACSATQLNWRKLGFDSARLVHLLGGVGLFHDAHRALDDCRALLEVLAFQPAAAAESRLGTLLGAARRPSIRVWAEGAAFEHKEKLKKRGYKWNDGTDTRGIVADFKIQRKIPTG